MRPAAVATNEVLVADKLVGFGGQGKVYSAWRRRGGDGGSAAGWDRVAVKCIGKVFHSTERAWRTLNEMRLLRLLRHPNIIGMQRALVAPPACHDSFNEVHIVMDLMDGDLASALYGPRWGIKDVQLDRQLCMYQILRGLAFMHAAGVLHRDLKPGNILLGGGGVKIGDLGYACCMLDTPPVQVGYTATPWYRAPELCGAYYSGLHPFAIDMWSAGCILAEMVLRTGPPFRGKSNDHVLVLICKALHKPSESFINGVANNDTSAFMRALPHDQWASSSFLQQIAHATAAEPELEDLLLSLLAFDPAARPTAAQALAQPYFRTLSHLGAIDTTEPRPLLDGGSPGIEAAAVRELLCHEIWSSQCQQA